MRSSEKHDEQAELPLAQHRCLTARGGEPARVEVQFPAIESISADSLRAALAHLGVAAAEHGANAREKLARAERLGDVVVGAQLEAHHAVGFVASSGEHDDPDRRL